MFPTLEPFPVPDTRQFPPQSAQRGRAVRVGRFQVERLRKSKTEAENLEAQSSERSRQPIENNDRPFSRSLESRQGTESKQVIWHKAVNMLKGQAVSEFGKGQNTETNQKNQLLRVVAVANRSNS